MGRVGPCPGLARARSPVKGAQPLVAHDVAQSSRQAQRQRGGGGGGGARGSAGGHGDAAAHHLQGVQCHPAGAARQAWREGRSAESEARVAATLRAVDESVCG